ncbi:potassium channel family protein [Reichenbachiella ulvae]|uniref:NAD-binding protein n=1 Tax=Reichenbachiella ulvae TaxID=2980104 RepID=A0ABT3CVY7_9BACT|nr:potassium channel protein [Reichenbachiella ulvae]MCV9387709.1 NAD-binding protein [Reichenbachiella ulvae]
MKQLNLFEKRRINRFIFAIILSFASLSIGVGGFIWIENYNLAEAFYMSIITISTVGYNEIHPLSADGRMFASFYIILNLGIFAYVVSVISTYIFEGELNQIYKKYLYHKEVKKMKDHVIVCGYGRNGAKACEELANSNVSFVIIERDEELANSIVQNTSFKVVQGDATSDEVLETAGIALAKSIIISLPNDAENVFLTLTSRDFNKDIKIIVRASEESSEKKLLRAGADKVIMPDAVGGLHMAQHITKPVVIDYLESLSGSDENGLQLEEIHIKDLKSEFVNKSIGELDIRKVSGVSILGLRKGEEKFLFNPNSHEKLLTETVIIIIGQLEEIKSFKGHFLA